jgi:hypothetical protein
MTPRFIFAAFFVAFGLTVIFAVVTIVKHVPITRAGASVMRLG